MEIARQWLEVQRATPSFTGDASLLPVDDTLLRGPLPPGLDESEYPSEYQQHHQHLLDNTGLVSSHSHNKSLQQKLKNYAAPVHDQLLAKGKLYQQRKEAMKERHVSSELDNMRNPRISEEAKKLKRDEKIQIRFQRLQQAKEEKAMYHRKTLEKEDDKQYARSFKPTITARARQASARSGTRHVGDALEAQMRRREERAAQVRLKYMMQDMSQVREVPSINPVSERLAARRREKEGMGSLTQIEAMIERDRIRKAAMWEKQREKEIEETSNPYPKITLYAANLNREGDERDVAERLYAESLEQEARRAERIQKSLYQNSNQSSSSSSSSAAAAGGGGSHTPRITSMAQHKKSSGPIEDELMRRHLDAMSHREELIRQQVDRERERRTPAINPVSDTIASRLPQTARERLAQPKAQFVDANEPSFAPRINPTSRELGAEGGAATSAAGGGGGGGDQLSQYGQYEQRRQEKIRQLRDEADQRELAECTFQPQIHSNPNSDNNNNNNNNQERDAEGNLVERSAQWLKRREAKLQQQRLQQQQQQSSTTTGDSPMARQQNDYRSNRTGGSSSSASAARAGSSNRRLHAMNASASAGDPQGVEDFVERLEEGRKRRHEQFAKLYATGSKWSGEATVPHDHKTPQVNQADVRSLRPPVTGGVVSLSGLTPPPPAERNEY